MKVLKLGAYPPPHGGVQTNLVAIRRYLRDNGIHCDVINLTRFRGIGGDGVYYPRNAFQVLRLLAKLRCDVIHLHIGGAITVRLLLLCLACSVVPWARTVLTLHSGGYPSSPEGRNARPRSFRGFVFRRLDRVIAVNAEIADLFRRFGLPERRIRLIPPFGPVSVRPTVTMPDSLRRFFDGHSPVLLTVGGLEPEYDIPIQIHALGRIRDQFPKAGLAIFGSGSIEREIRRGIAETAYADHVHLGGDVPHDVTLRAMEACDILLRTTLYDGDSIAVREALALGIPVIASDNGMRPDGVDLVPVADLPALESAIRKNLASPCGGRRRARDIDDANLAAVLDLYRELL